MLQRARGIQVDVGRQVILAVRSLRRSAALSLVLIATLSIGIGLAMTVFGLLNSLFFRELGVWRPAELMFISGKNGSGPVPLPPAVLDRMKERRTFAGLCGFQTQEFAVELPAGPRPSPAEGLSGDCFETLGVKPAIGRLVAPSDDSAARERVVVLSYSSWKKEYGGNSNVLGQALHIEGTPYTIIGVTEPKFTGLLLGFPPTILLPLKQMPSVLTDDNQGPARGADPIWVIGRNYPGIPFEQTASRITETWPRLLESAAPPEYSAEQKRRLLALRPSTASAATGLDYVFRDLLRTPLYALSGIAVLVFALCCVNVSGLLLLRGLGRHRDTAVRMALGAGRWQVIVPLVYETGIVAVLSALIGCGLAYGVSQHLLTMVDSLYSNVSLFVGIDLRVGIFAFVITLSVAVLSGLIPCLTVGDLNLSRSLNSNQGMARAHSSWKRALIISQLSLTLIMLVAAGTFVQTLKRFDSSLASLDTQRILEVRLNPVAAGYHNLDGSVYYHDLLDQVRSLSTVQQASLSHTPPLSESRNPETASSRDSACHTAQVTVETLYVSDSFFDTFGIPFVDGKTFASGTSATPGSVILTESLAKRLCSGVPVLGRHISLGTSDATQEPVVVGIVRDVQLADLHLPDSYMAFLNYWQYPRMQTWPTLCIRARYSTNLLPSISQQIKARGREYAASMRTFTEQRDIQLFQERALATLAVALSAIGIFLAIVGLYSLLGYNVSVRTRELGIRTAMGARKQDLVWLVIRESLWLTLFAMLVGVPLTIVVIKVLTHLLYGLNILDKWLFLAATCLLVFTDVMAAVIPGMRAANRDTVADLRAE